MNFTPNSQLVTNHVPVDHHNIFSDSLASQDLPNPPSAFSTLGGAFSPHAVSSHDALPVEDLLENQKAPEVVRNSQLSHGGRICPTHTPTPHSVDGKEEESPSIITSPRQTQVETICPADDGSLEVDVISDGLVKEDHHRLDHTVCHNLPLGHVHFIVMDFRKVINRASSPQEKPRKTLQGLMRGDPDRLLVRPYPWPSG